MDRNLIDQLAIKTLKINGIAAVNRASSGHPGIVLGAATIIHTLFSRIMNYLPSEPTWINRDRFIMSAGHGSALLYSQLRILGLISEEQLKNFRQLGSETAGHPEYNLKLGIEMTTGPLGQGIASAVGIALAEKHLNSKFKEIDHFTYVLCGDGDLQEGISYEAMSFAGHNELNKLIILYDSNDIQLDTPVKKTFSEDIKKRVESQNWDYQLVTKNEVDEIEKAILNAKKSNKPSLIEIKTIIGQDATNQNTPKVHGAPLGNDIENVVKKLNWTYDDLFFIPKEVKELYKKTLIARSRKALKLFNPSSKLIQFLTYKYIKIKVKLPKDQATRVTSGLVIEHLNDKLPLWIGGSADLSSSTKAKGADGDFSPLNPSNRNILFGVREFSMAAIANGIALHSQLIPFVSTFAVFSDYLKPALRLSALMKLRVVYILTHDSVFVGEDGPTHQPIEQLAMLRSIPRVNVIRPADENEVQRAYEVALNSSGPSVILLTRQNVKSLELTKKNDLINGYYPLYKSKSDWNIIATGSELENALTIAKELNLNCYSLFNHNQIEDYQLNKAKTITIEASSSFAMAKFGNYNLSIDNFGYSGPGDQVYKKCNMDLESLKTSVSNIMNMILND